MGPKYYFEATLSPDDNPQDGPSNPNTGATVTESTSVEFIRNGIVSSTQFMSSGSAEDFVKPTKETAQESAEDRDTPTGRRRALKMRALVPVFACYVCYNAGTGASD